MENVPSQYICMWYLLNSACAICQFITFAKVYGFLPVSGCIDWPFLYRASGYWTSMDNKRKRFENCVRSTGTISNNVYVALWIDDNLLNARNSSLKVHSPISSKCWIDWCRKLICSAGCPLHKFVKHLFYLSQYTVIILSIWMSKKQNRKDEKSGALIF